MIPYATRRGSMRLCLAGPAAAALDRFDRFRRLGGRHSFSHHLPAQPYLGFHRFRFGSRLAELDAAGLGGQHPCLDPFVDDFAFVPGKAGEQGQLEPRPWGVHHAAVGSTQGRGERHPSTADELVLVEAGQLDGVRPPCSCTLLPEEKCRSHMTANGKSRLIQAAGRCLEDFPPKTNRGPRNVRSFDHSQTCPSSERHSNIRGISPGFPSPFCQTSSTCRDWTLEQDRRARCHRSFGRRRVRRRFFPSVFEQVPRMHENARSPGHDLASAR